MVQNNGLLINEEQEKYLADYMIAESTGEFFNVNPDKVLLVKRFLDSNFQKGTEEVLGNDGFAHKDFVIKMVDSQGNELKSMKPFELVELLEEKFKTMFFNRVERKSFLTQVAKDWINNKISPEGLLSVNKIKI